MRAAFTLGSLWDVLQHDGSKFIAELGAVEEFGKTLRRLAPGAGANFQTPAYETIVRCSESIHQFCTDLELVSGDAACARLRMSMGSSRVTYQPDGWVNLDQRAVPEISANCLDLAMRVLDEMKLRSVFWVPLRGRALVAQNGPPFGANVERVFPKASEDISEAGMCLGLGRWTASVFHLMRATEVMVQRLAKKLKIGNTDRVWGLLLSDISKAVEAMPKGAKRNNWSEVHTHLYHVKQAWRNDTMHPKQTYTEEEARAIYSAVDTFSRRLAALV
jgi:hypothetical protein